MFKTLGKRVDCTSCITRHWTKVVCFYANAISKKLSWQVANNRAQDIIQMHDFSAALLGNYQHKLKLKIHGEYKQKTSSIKDNLKII